MKILSVAQTRKADRYTIDNEPIASIDLMERAARSIADWFRSNFKEKQRVAIFSGPGNNGGDGLALARLLHSEAFEVEVFLASESGSEDFKHNLVRLPAEIKKFQAFSFQAEACPYTIVVDALFGSGLSRALEGDYLNLVRALNACRALKVSVDIPSGLFADPNKQLSSEGVFRAHYSLSFQHPKLAMLCEPGLAFCGETIILDIGLASSFYAEQKSDYYYLESEDIKELYRPRAKHSYKGTYGHLLSISGSVDKMGAALIAAEAALRSGLGLLTASIPKEGFTGFNSSLPEAMLQDRKWFNAQELARFNAILIGPGLGLEPESERLLKQSIQEYGGALVLDADALRLLADNPTWLAFLPTGTILTPHLGELKALLDRKELGFDYIETTKDLARKHQVYVLIKNSISALVSPNGKVFFADFGSPALAKGGSGDLLAGCIASLRAQAYTPMAAVCLALFLQGRAAKLAASKSHVQAVLSRDVCAEIGSAYSDLAAK